MVRTAGIAGSAEERTGTAVLLTHLRWCGALLGVVQALFVLNGPARTVGLVIPAAIAGYNALTVLGCRRRGLVRALAPAIAIAGDFGAVVAWTALTASDPHSLTYTFGALIGVEAAFLYGRVGAVALALAFGAVLAAFTAAGSPAFGGSFEVSLVDRAGVVLLLIAFTVVVREHLADDKRRVRTAEEQTRTILESATSAVITTDEAARITGWNGRAERTFSRAAATALGKPLTEVLGPGAVLEPGVRRITGRRQGGTEFPIEVSVTGAFTPDGERQYIVFAEDVTDRQRGEAMQAARYAVTYAINQAYSIEDGVPGVLQAICQTMDWSVGLLWRLDSQAGALVYEAIWHADTVSGGDLEEASRGLVFHLGEGLPGTALAAGAAVTLTHVGAEGDGRDEVLLAEGLRAGLAIPIRHGDELTGVLEFYMHSPQQAGDDVLVAMSELGVQIGQWLDREAIRARLRAEEDARRAAEDRARRALEFRAFHDLLTGLPNRHLFADRLGQRLALARREHKPLAVMILDVDRFKEVNDRFGHFAGDLVLEEVARRLQAALRSSDTAARIGGDEFAILPGGDVDRAAVEQIAAKIRAAFAAPAWHVDGVKVELGASIGIALFPDDGGEAGDLLEAADAAMYAAKRAAASRMSRAAE